MTTNTTRRRSRERAHLTIDLRQMRLALGLDVKAAAIILGEPQSLLFNQEEAGRDADRGFLDETRDKYLAHALAAAASGDFPPVVVKSATTIYWLRHGLGLTHTEAGKILKLRPAAVEDIETASRAFPETLRQQLWATYVEWASRAVRRQERWKSARPQRAAIAPVAINTRINDLVAMQSLAYGRQMSPAEAEAEVLRLLS
jgi:hypothetical protein